MINPFNDIKEISGIGSVQAEKLKEIGIFYTENLLKNTSGEMGRELDHIIGITKAQVELDYFVQAQFLRLENITEKIASYFVDNQYNYKSLAFGNVSEIIELLESKNILVDENQVLKWQLESAKRINTNTVTIKVIDQNNKIVQGAEVIITNPTDSGYWYNLKLETNEQGIVLFEKISNPMLSVTAFKNGFGNVLDIPLAFKANYSNFVLKLEIPFSNEEVFIDEKIDGKRCFKRPEYTKHFLNDELLEINQFFISSISDNEIRLSSVYRKLINANWRIESIKIPKIDLGFEVEMLDIVERNGNDFIHTNSKFIK